jgi:DTW domain-containing protein YfiP
MRPVALCFCAGLPTVPTRTRLVVIQHPHERLHPFGTVRLLRLCLPNSEVHVPWAGFTGTLEQRVPVPDDTVLLFPRPGAPRLDQLEGPPPSTLLVLDGTWPHAKRLYRENGWLERLRHVQLPPGAESRYRIRKEPKADYVSTLEAVVAALRVLEPAERAEGLGALVASFDRMIDRQIDHSAAVMRFGRSKRPRQRPSRARSPLLADPRLVVGYAESALPGGDPANARELVQWVAVRPTDGAVFEALLRPGPVPSAAAHLAHMGLSLADLAAGETVAAAAARFAAWLEPGAPVTAWTPTSLTWARELLPPDTARTALKTSWCNVANRRPGFVEQVVADCGLQPVPVACRGRASERLGNALAVLRWLRADDVGRTRTARRASVGSAPS